MRRRPSQAQIEIGYLYDAPAPELVQKLNATIGPKQKRPVPAEPRRASREQIRAGFAMIRAKLATRNTPNTRKGNS